jgi:hypothetical protein
VGAKRGRRPSDERKRRLRLSVPAPRPRFKPLVERKAWWRLSVSASRLWFRPLLAARRGGSHQSAQSVNEGIGSRSASAVQAVSVTQGVVEAIGRGLVPPAEGTRHSTKPNASFLWGEGRRPLPAGGAGGGQRPAVLRAEDMGRGEGKGNGERGARRKGEHRWAQSGGGSRRTSARRIRRASDAAWYHQREKRGIRLCRMPRFFGGEGRRPLPAEGGVGGDQRPVALRARAHRGRLGRGGIGNGAQA